MKISYQWLQEFVDLEVLNLGVDEIGKALTRLGLAVESIEPCGEDSILDVEVTTNRPDCLNHLGVARELAVQFQLELKAVDFSIPPQGREAAVSAAHVAIDDPELCPRYAAQVMTGVKIGPSPDWLRRRLESLGQRSINNVVDVTNYVLLEVGHPLHAFDYEKLEERRIVVRRAREGEKLVTLDGLRCELLPSMLMICDAARPVALAGIMGGQESEISESTETLLLESAYFAPPSIRATARKLGLRTEASYRFERGADPELPVKALNRACRLIQQVAGGVCAGPVIDQYPNRDKPVVVELPEQRIRQVVGESFPREFVTDLLQRLQFKVLESTPQALRVEVPSFRPDVEMADDLIEEIARHHGYDRIASTYPAATVPGRFRPRQSHDRILTRTLEGLGFYEAVHYSFTTPAAEALFWERLPSMISLANPLSEEATHLRTTLVPGLVDSVRRNLNHGNKNVRLFEVGKVFLPRASGNPEDYDEVTRLGLAATGLYYHPFWSGNRDEFQFHHLKGVIHSLLQRLGQAVEFRRSEAVPFLHPGVGAEVILAGQATGWLGELHPRLQQSYKFLQKVLVAELLLDPVYARPLPEPLYRSLSRFPCVERDLSFLIDKQVQYDRIVAAIKGLNIPDLGSIQLLDLYQSQALPPGKVSLTIRLTFANPERTLTQEEVKGYQEAVFSTLRSAFSAEPR